MSRRDRSHRSDQSQLQRRADKSAPAPARYSVPCPRTALFYDRKQAAGSACPTRSLPSRKSRKARLPTCLRDAIPLRGEKDWAEKTLLPTLEKAPEKPIGAPTGINLRRARPRPLHHDFRRPDSPPLHPSRSARRLERGKISGLSRAAAVHARHSRQRISRQAFHHAPVLRLRLAGRNQPALQISAGTAAAADSRSPSICPR